MVMNAFSHYFAPCLQALRIVLLLGRELEQRFEIVDFAFQLMKRIDQAA